MSEPHHGRHEDPDDQSAAPVGWIGELKAAISLRTVALVTGVLLLQLGFILSYVGAFHAPKPHNISVAVVAPAQVSAQTLAGLNGLATSPLKATLVADEATARARITSGDLSAALIVGSGSTTDTLLVSSAGGTSVATAVESVLTQVEAAQKRTLTTQDIVPLQDGDGRGLTGFYLVIGWIVGGYLLAAILGVAKGSRPANHRRTLIRLVSMVPYAIISGLGGAIVVGPALGALTGHFMALWWLGALIVLSAATVTMAFQVLFGVIGIGITVLVFVILGNPSAGGAYQPEVLPPFWRALSPLLPNGAGTEAVRRIAYFGSTEIGRPLLVIAAYAIVGGAVAIGASALHSRKVAEPAAA